MQYIQILGQTYCRLSYVLEPIVFYDPEAGEFGHAWHKKIHYVLKVRKKLRHQPESVAEMCDDLCAYSDNSGQNVSLEH